jgi:hypothetical protein
MRGRMALAFATMLLVVPGLARGADPVAVLTEIEISRGKVEVASGGTGWSAPKPLQSLRDGDQIRVEGAGRAVLVFTGGRGTQIVDRNNSPYTVRAKSDAGAGDRAKAVIGGVTNFLLGQQRERTYQSLSVRGVETTMLGPRGNTKVRPDKVMIEWVGSDTIPYTVRLKAKGSSDVVWQQTDIQRAQVKEPAVAPPLTPNIKTVWEVGYPASGTALTPGKRYCVELIPLTGDARTEDQARKRSSLASGGSEASPCDSSTDSVRKGEFEIASAADVAKVRDELALLTPEKAPGYTPATLTLIRGGLLFQHGFYAEARREVEAGIAKAPDEQTLYLLLADIYDRLGLRPRAARAYDEAERLGGR